MPVIFFPTPPFFLAIPLLAIEFPVIGRFPHAKQIFIKGDYIGTRQKNNRFLEMTGL